ncbi:hypothetical protein ASG40_11555 [Methylobacterium sp. Leaf399]|uniref:hypothetical protein n=1 Tax=Methylobacterium sp. Leaf399 TaxID=1736364 RepID=UPI000715C39F|nr:hypothetical protein [Methylobacterium sp. Leaf399]KQT08509.1 hypothetical protein ASG40_11555 [Methylobacterium sp. Leaf399]
MTSEVRRMREMEAQGLSRFAIGRALGRHETTVSRYLIDPGEHPARTMKLACVARHAARVERLFAACNQALGLSGLRGETRGPAA